MTHPRGNELLRQVVNQIISHPETWNQSKWHCDTQHCVGGWSQVLGGLAINDDTCREDAQQLLELSDGDAEWLFSSVRTLPQIYSFAKNRLSGDGYNRSGYDQYGYNRDGYDRDGYNRHGYDQDGYDQAGYNRDGYNRHGYDQDGYDQAGYNRDGYNRDGYDWDGYNRDGYNRDGYNRDGYDRDGKMQFELL